MIFECAPLEGITDTAFRRTHAELFGAADKYYTPFISPTATHLFSARNMRELSPEGNAGLNVVPQLIGHSAEDMLWAANELYAMGYGEMNINLGCPSGTVVKKKKGSGLLAEPEMLRALLNELFEKSPIDISIKTRIGKLSADELPTLLELYSRYPIKELVIHPRTGNVGYNGKPDYEAFRLAGDTLKVPLCYNGDVFDKPAAEKISELFPDCERIMLGRGLAANPALIRSLRGGAALDKSEERQFHDALFSQCEAVSCGETPLLFHMKELWFYMAKSFTEPDKAVKRIRKARTKADYLSAVSALFSECDVRENAGFISVND